MSIYVVGHKAAPVPASDLYKIIAVGNEKNFFSHFRDDSGDNISHLNKYYCELTAYYWIWKNANPDFVGICHYRRYFNLLPNNRFSEGWVDLAYDESTAGLLAQSQQKEKIEELLDVYDIIVPRYWPTPFSLGESYVETQNSEDWRVFLEEVDFLFGRNNHPLRVENRNIYGNMLICDWRLFDLYCHQLFFVINRVFARIGIYEEVPGKRYQNYRYPGYLAERFLSAFIYAHRLRAFEGQIIMFNNI
jgi:Domain of unknown function (DUF4422)